MSNIKMIRRLYLFFVFLGFVVNFCKAQKNNPSNVDILKIDSLLKISIDYRYSNPQKGLEIAEQALYMSKTNSYESGLAEAYRTIGINYTYLNKRDSSISFFLRSLKVYQKINNPEGVAKSYNNLGNSYGQYNNNRALEYYKHSLSIATKNNLKNLIAAAHLNIGVVYSRMKEYQNSIYYFYKAMPIFSELEDKNGLMLCYQNIGVSKYYLKEYNESEESLLKAYKLAKEDNYKNTVSSINLTLSRIKMIANEFDPAEKYIEEGIKLANELYDEKLLYDFSLTSYELEKKRKNFQDALHHLEKVHSRDSLYYRENVSNILTLTEEQQKNLEKQKEYEIQLEKQEKHLILLIFSIIVLILCIAVIILLVKSKRKTDKSNIQLKKLNEEISVQKENLNQINLKLEDIIAERTKDLISKNQKLSEYSSHLSHQIRGPVATLKGLIMLSEDDLMDEKDCIKQMKRCVDDIDDKIMDINIALHDPSRKGLSKKTQDD